MWDADGGHGVELKLRQGGELIDRSAGFVSAGSAVLARVLGGGYVPFVLRETIVMRDRGRTEQSRAVGSYFVNCEFGLGWEEA